MVAVQLPPGLTYLEQRVRTLLDGHGLPPAEVEDRLDQEQKWRFDLCWPR